MFDQNFDRLVEASREMFPRLLAQATFLAETGFQSVTFFRFSETKMLHVRVNTEAFR